MAADHSAHLGVVEVLGERRAGRHDQDGEEGAEILGRGLHIVVEEAQDVAGLLERVEDGTGDDRGDRVQAELERGDDAEVAATAAQGPEKVGVLGDARRR
jgi:hypothetical protein